MSTPEAAPAVDAALADRFQLKAFVESCLVLEEGIAGVRDIDLGMMMGTGMIPGPFAARTSAGWTTCSPPSRRPRTSGASTSSRR